jgi:hypothetical protein
MAASADAGFGLRGLRLARERFLYVLQQTNTAGARHSHLTSGLLLRRSGEHCRCQSGQQVEARSVRWWFVRITLSGQRVLNEVFAAIHGRQVLKYGHRDNRQVSRRLGD